MLSEMVYIFKKNDDNVASIHSVPGPLIPHTFTFGVSGAVCKDKLIFGRGCHLFIYNVPSSQWFSIRNISKENDARMGLYSSMGKIRENILIVVGGEWSSGDKVELIRFEESGSQTTNYTNPESYTQRSLIHKNAISRPLPNSVPGSTGDSQYSLNSYWVKCPTKLPVKVAFSSLIQIEENKVMLIGGKVMGCVSTRVFQGTLSLNEKNVTWTELSSLNIARSNHLCFRLHDTIFVAGGYNTKGHKLKSCERYDIKQNKWYQDNSTEQNLPLRLSDASVVVAPDETFAAIMGGFPESDLDVSRICNVCRKKCLFAICHVCSVASFVIIFNETDGFKLSKDFTLFKR